jgi:glycosyltransferase involved in cell wall biosynthesis
MLYGENRMKTSKYNFDLLFLGGVFDERKIIKESKNNVQFAANVLQWNIIEGLDQLNAQPVNLLNAKFIGSFPKFYKKAFIKRRVWSHTFGAKDIDTRFLNLPIIKKYSRGWNLSKEIRRWSKKKDTRKKVIIAYSMDYSLLKAVKAAKKVNPAIRTCLIVPDLPQFMNLSSSETMSYKFLKNIESVLIEKLRRYVDSYVLLTEHMAGFLKLENEPFVVVEGMVNVKEDNKMDVEMAQRSKSKTILYTGTLNEKYGVLDLLEAFSLIDKQNYRLQICGTGETEKIIQETAKRDKRIDFLGRVSREEAVKLQKRATVLINPRSNEGEFTKYSFPSKIMEYLVSGVPTIAYKLPGMPEEYNNYLFFIENNSIRSMKDTILNVCEMNSEELKQFGALAKRFVLKEKNNIKQVMKILSMF